MVNLFMINNYFSGSNYSAKLNPIGILFFLKLTRTLTTFRQSSCHLPLICFACLGCITGKSIVVLKILSTVTKFLSKNYVKSSPQSSTTSSGLGLSFCSFTSSTCWRVTILMASIPGISSSSSSSSSEKWYLVFLKLSF